jgi:hypothetical protein
MKRNLMTMAVVTALAASMGMAALADDAVNVVVNGETIDFTGDQAPVILNDRTLVPFRAVFEKMGAKVNWYEDSQTCEATYGSITVTLMIGDNVMHIGDATTVAVDVPAQIINDRTMVPIRVISEGIGATVGWDEDTRTVTVNSPEVTESFPESVESIKASAGVTNEEKGVTVTFDYPVVTDEYTASNKLNDSILADIIDAAQQIADSYNGDEKEINISYSINANANGEFEVLYSVNDEELVYKASYAIASGSRIDNDIIENQEDEDRVFNIVTYTADKKDENGDAYITAYADYPQFTAAGDAISSLNTQLENSAKKAADSFVETYANEALDDLVAEYSFGADCTVELGDDNTAVITTKYTEITAGNATENTDVITVNLETGEAAD